MSLYFNLTDLNIGDMFYWVDRYPSESSWFIVIAKNKPKIEIFHIAKGYKVVHQEHASFPKKNDLKIDGISQVLRLADQEISAKISV